MILATKAVPFLLLLLASLFSRLNGFLSTPASAPARNHCSKVSLKQPTEDERPLSPYNTSRRRLLQNTASLILFTPPQSVLASDTTSEYKTFVRDGKDNLHYSVKLPSSWSEPSNKPLKTHLDEVNFANNAGSNIGITVDPVRISSLKQFGTPAEVAARVVTAEVNRDGVFEVTLETDPMELPDGSYVLQYLSQGKRGNKRNLVKIFIADQKLYVLTAQVKQDAYDQDTEKTIQAIVESFSIK